MLEIHGQDNRKMPLLARSVLGRNPIVPDSPIGMGGGSPSVVPPVSGARLSGRGMRPAGGNSRSPRKLNVISTSEIGEIDSFSDGLVVRKNARAMPLSVGEEVFSPGAVPSGRAPIEEGSDDHRNYVPPRELSEGLFGLNDAVVLTPAVFSGAVAPADLAGTDVPAVAPLVIRASKQLWAVVGVGPMRDIGSVDRRKPTGLSDSVDKRPSEEGSGPVDIVTVPKPIEHSVGGVPSEEGSSPVHIMTVPEPIEHSDVRGTAVPPSACHLMEHSRESRELAEWSAEPCRRQ